jgi:hypothetical protein
MKTIWTPKRGFLQYFEKSGKFYFPQLNRIANLLTECYSF